MPKQKPAAPPARRRVFHLAMPARSGCRNDVDRGKVRAISRRSKQRRFQKGPDVRKWRRVIPTYIVPTATTNGGLDL